MRVLAIETSCDDTCVAIIKSKIKNKKSKIFNFEILSNIVSSQVKIHAKYGGVYPFLAKKEHQRNLAPVLKEALMKARLLKSKVKNKKSKLKFKVQNSLKNIDFIAVTVGPGLEPCLWVGVNFAKDLAKNWNLPLIPINHIEAHILANFIRENPKFQITNSKQIPNSKLQNSKLFPAVCLLVSGGHTQLVLMQNIGEYKILGETRDDAAGECFDKVARILGLGYPGGPAIAAEAAKYKIPSFTKASEGKQDTIYPPSPRLRRASKIQLPRPMIYQKNYDFSFSGLKTTVLYHFQNQPPKIKKSKKYIQAMATEAQQAIIDVLIYKTLKAAKEYKAKSIVLGGGVAANSELRKQFQQRIKKEMPNTKYIIPDTRYCTDNAVMTAVAGYFHWEKGERCKLEDIEADANQRI